MKTYDPVVNDCELFVDLLEISQDMILQSKDGSDERTYANSRVVCPYCAVSQDVSLSELLVGQVFGPWTCQYCWGSYSGKVLNVAVMTWKGSHGKEESDEVGGA